MYEQNYFIILELISYNMKNVTYTYFMFYPCNPHIKAYY